MLRSSLGTWIGRRELALWRTARGPYVLACVLLAAVSIINSTLIALDDWKFSISRWLAGG